MKGPGRIIDRFCSRHPNFGIPNLMRYIVIANIVFWLLNFVNGKFIYYMTFSPFAIMHGQVWRLISFVFIPPGTGIIAFIAFYFYYVIGSSLEQHWGTAKFNLYFLTGVLLTIIYGFLVYFITGRSCNLSAVYIYLSLFFSFAALFPDMQVLLFFIIPIKIKYLAIVDGILFILGVIGSRFPENLLPVVAVLNFVIFCGGEMFRPLRRRPASATTVNFRREAAKIRNEEQRRLYNHRCCVCGRTDRDYPDLEFRYCSKCAGYRCFCADHINSHVHFTTED